MTLWKSPETAPKDGQKIRMANAYLGNVEAYFDGQNWVVDDLIYPGSKHYPHLYAWAPGYAVLLPPPEYEQESNGRLRAVL